MFSQPSDWRDYVRDDQFSVGKSFSLQRDASSSRDRLEVLEEIARSRRVIHFGFADHLSLISRKRESNTWLHDRLRACSEACAGLDINREAVDHITRHFGVDDCHVFDLLTDEVPEEVRTRAWDFVLMGEILEHTDNPVEFLGCIRNKFQGIADKLVVTVPNGLSAENVAFALRNREVINTDHRYWFSPFTLAKVGCRAGLPLNDLWTCGSTSGRGILYRALVRFVPMMRETVVAVFSLREEA